MRHSSRGRKLIRFSWGVVYAGLVAATPVFAGPIWRARTKPVPAAPSPASAASDAADLELAPYAIRLRISGFLARQHARDGDTQRAIQEFHAMLATDDPSWPGGSEADPMRIERDMDVADMMADAGFHDHALRVLQAAWILARVNDDPQLSKIEQQMRTTLEAARIKQVPVSLFGWPRSDAGIRQTSASDDVPIIEPPREPAGTDTVPGPSLEAGVTPLDAPPGDASTWEPLPEPGGPTVGSDADLVAEPEALDAPPARHSKLHFLAKLLPSHWHHKHPRLMYPPVVESHPRYSPDLSPAYCPDCAAQYGGGYLPPPAAWAQTGDAARGGTGPSIIAAAPPEKSSRLRRLLHAFRPGGGSSDTPMVYAVPPGAASEPVPAEPPVQEHRSVTARLFGHRLFGRAGKPGDAPPLARAEHAPSYEAPLVNEVSEPDTNGPELADPDARSDMKLTAHQDAADADPVPAIARQVGVAGQVVRPGIYPIEGTSTTLQSLLRRANGELPTSAHEAWILRSVDFSRVAETLHAPEAGSQRVDLGSVEPGGLKTAVYPQEVVVVEGAAENPIYIAVMPHFILQIPEQPNRPVTVASIVEKLREHWPTLRQENVRVARRERRGMVERPGDADPAARSHEAVLHTGDILFVDGLGLDASQVAAVADSIAKLAEIDLRDSHWTRMRTAAGSAGKARNR